VVVALEEPAEQEQMVAVMVVIAVIIMELLALLIQEAVAEVQKTVQGQLAALVF
jgi:hypothetical protein